VVAEKTNKFLITFCRTPYNANVTQYFFFFLQEYEKYRLREILPQDMNVVAIHRLSSMGVFQRKWETNVTFFWHFFGLSDFLTSQYSQKCATIPKIEKACSVATFAIYLLQIWWLSIFSGQRSFWEFGTRNWNPNSKIIVCISRALIAIGPP